ncbi:MAG: hypothetical protein U1F43_14840 [Myxococcota bacterium]
MTPLEIPTFRDILSLSGRPEALVGAIAALRSAAPLPPLVHLQAQVGLAGLEKGLASALERPAPAVG